MLFLYRRKMNLDFQNVALVICIFVAVREFRPIEPFLTKYLTEPPISLTNDEVNEKVYPIGTYASCAFAIVMFLITDYLRYKPIIIFDGITGIMTYILILGEPSMLRFTIEQIFFGFFWSSDVACNTYLYAKIEDPSQYQKITGFVRASSLIGRFINGVFAQLSVSYEIFDSKRSLLLASIFGMVFVTFWGFIIPNVDHSIYFHRKEELKGKRDTLNNASIELSKSDEKITVVKSVGFKVVCLHLWSDFKAAYSNLYVLKWSMWWAFSCAGYYYVATYSQVLWQEIAPRDEFGESTNLMNGAVESISTITGAASAYLISRTNLKWEVYGDYILVLVSLILSSLILFFYFCTSLWIIYTAYVVYCATFHTILTISQSEVAKNLKKDSYALIFGFNGFVALGAGSVITYCIIEGHVIRFSTRGQFLFYSFYYLVITFLVLIKAVTSLIRRNDKQYYY